jgi:hypothetical protein
MERIVKIGSGRAAVLVMAVCLLMAPTARAAVPLATANVGPTAIEWQPSTLYEKLVLTVSGPGGLILRREFGAGVAPSFGSFGDDGQPLPDGAYTYELVASPVLDQATRRALAIARRSGDESIVEKLRAAGKLPRDPLIQSGSFSIAEGAIVPQAAREDGSGGNGSAQAKADSRLQPITAEDQVISDDLIVQGSACIGPDCVNNEGFSSDTVKLKGSSTRFKFEDTSTAAGFPTHDWQLTANDSTSGGAEKFSIEDITAATVPFTVTGSAATNSIFVDSTGRVGFRTSTPVLDLHVATSNTPAMRLEQNNSGGFTAQTWDIAGNEANFFVRDVTGGSRLPFRIRPGAPTSSIDINASGNVGIGTASPSDKLHVTSADAGPTGIGLLVADTNGTTAQREIAEFRNTGGVSVICEDTSVPERWSFGTNGSNFIINNQNNPNIEFTLSNTGNLTITGVYSPSDRNLKKDIVPVRGNEILTKLASVPVSTWTFKTDDVRHIGPMAQDFAAAFGLGIDDKHISPNDLAGVSLAAVQGLDQVVQEKEKEIAELKSRIEKLEKMVQGLSQPKQ